MNNIFVDISVIIIIATLLAYLARLLRQPLIPAYILAGLLIGPFGLGLIKDIEFVKTISEIGIAFLLFVVGLDLDIKKLKNIGAIATFGTLIQVGFLTFIGYSIGITLGFTPLNSIYIGLLIAFSSTMVVIKLLSDKKQLDSLHGHIIIGILLMQDILAIIALSLLNNTGHFSYFLLFASLFKGVLLLALMFLNSMILPVIMRVAARSTELLFLVSLTLCFTFSLLAHFLGFSLAIGAFIAGVSLANLPYSYEIVGKIKPVRDFFATIFFVSLGMGVILTGISEIILPLIIITVIVILAKPLLNMFITALFGYTKRISFLTSISLAQVSEFSLIMITQGFLLGHLSENFLSMTIIITLITLTLTSYFIKFDNFLYKKSAKMLTMFDWISKARHLGYHSSDKKYKIILIGYDRLGFGILRVLQKINKKILIVDFNPDIIKKLIKRRISCLYGDISDPEIFERIDLRHTEMFISTVPSLRENIHFIHLAKRANKKIIVFVTANQIDEALELYSKGADYVILPHFLGGDYVSSLLEDIYNDKDKLKLTRNFHLEELKERIDAGHEHPTSYTHYKE